MFYCLKKIVSNSIKSISLDQRKNFGIEKFFLIQRNFFFKEFENLSMEKKTLSTALGFEPRSFDCRSTALTTELHRRPTSPSQLINLKFFFYCKSKKSFFDSKKLFFSAHKYMCNVLDRNIFFNLKNSFVHGYKTE